MRQLTFLVSLITRDNDYQREQVSAAEEIARRLGAKLQFAYAENDAINQSQQILSAVQSPPAERPDGIVFEPVGTGLAQVAKAATQAAVGWAVLNREVDYIAELRPGRRAPIFSLSSDHEEVGRIQGRQMGALLPNGGMVPYIEGPSSGSAARQRTQGMYATKPANVQIRTNDQGTVD
jgi:ABC-type sugar transport system substrate-binding protein